MNDGFDQQRTLGHLTPMSMASRGAVPQGYGIGQRGRAPIPHAVPCGLLGRRHRRIFCLGTPSRRSARYHRVVSATKVSFLAVLLQ